MIDTKALRSRVLDLAIQGKLSEQLPSDGTAEELYQQIQAEKQALIKEDKIKKEKPLPDIKPEEVPFEIPRNWKWVRIGQVINEVIVPQRDKPSFSGDIPWCRIEDKDGIFLNGTKSGQYVSKETVKEMNLRIFPIGTVLSACSGASIGTILITTVECCTNQTFNGLVCSTGLYNWFLFWYLKSAITKLKSMGTGSAMAYISQDRIRNMLLPLPPLVEQKRIVERVEEIFRLLDTIDEAQEKYAADSESLKAKLITAGIQGKLTEQLDSDGTAEELYQQIQEEKQKLIKEGKIKKEKSLPAISDEEIPFEIPGNWKWVRFGEISNIICTGLIRSGKEQYKDGEYYYFKMQNIGNFTGKCNFDDMVMINASQEEFEKTKLEEGDFLFNTRNSAELVGKAAVVHNMPMPKIILNNNILKIRFYGSIYPDFVNYVFISSEGRNLLYQFVSSTTNVAAIYQRQIVTLTVPLPPLAEQKRIVEVLEKAMGVLE